MKAVVWNVMEFEMKEKDKELRASNESKLSKRLTRCDMKRLSSHHNRRKYDSSESEYDQAHSSLIFLCKQAVVGKLIDVVPSTFDDRRLGLQFSF